MEKTTNATPEVGNPYNAFFSGTSDAESSQSRSKYLEVLKKQGFYAATLSSSPDMRLLDEMIAAHREHATKLEDEWKSLLQRFHGELDDKIGKTQDDIAALETEKQAATTDLKDLEENKKRIQSELEELRKQLFEFRKENMPLKGGLEEKFIATIDVEMNKLTEIQNRVYNDLKSLYDKDYNSTKTGRDYIKDKIIEQRSRYQSRFDMIDQKLRLIGAHGINSGTAYLLYMIGLGTAGVAGYFYSIFAAQSGVSSNDAFYYLLKNIIEAAAAREFPFWIKVIIFFAGLIMVTLVSFLSHLAIKKLNSGKPEDFEKEELSYTTAYKNENNDFSATVQTKSWLSFWFRIIPVISVIAFIIFIISLNATIGEETNKLSGATEGLVIGAALALGLSAVLYIYMTKVIEPRIEGRAELLTEQNPVNEIDSENWDQQPVLNKRYASRFLLNWELIASLVVFILAMVVFAFYNQGFFGGLKMRNPLVSIAVIGFSASVIITAFAFAYGLRYFGLISAGRAAENQISICDGDIALLMNPLPPGINISLRENMKMLGKIQSELMLSRAGRLINKESRENVFNKSVDKFNQLIAGIPFISAKPEPAGKALFTLEDWELLYYPEYAGQVKIMSEQYGDKKTELEETERKIGVIKNGTDNKSQLKKQELKELRERVDKWNETRNEISMKHLLKSDALKYRVEEEIMSLREGFETGIWSRNNGINTSADPVASNN